MFPFMSSSRPLTLTILLSFAMMIILLLHQHLLVSVWPLTEASALGQVECTRANYEHAKEDGRDDSDDSDGDYVTVREVGEQQCASGGWYDESY